MAPSIVLSSGFKWNLQALTNAADSIESGGKSPVSVLNELGVKVLYKVLQQAGPPHCPCFTVSVKVSIYVNFFYNIAGPMWPFLF